MWHVSISWALSPPHCKRFTCTLIERTQLMSEAPKQKFIDLNECRWCIFCHYSLVASHIVDERFAMSGCMFLRVTATAKIDLSSSSCFNRCHCNLIGFATAQHSPTHLNTTFFSLSLSCLFSIKIMTIQHCAKYALLLLVLFFSLFQQSTYE